MKVERDFSSEKVYPTQFGSFILRSRILAGKILECRLLNPFPWAMQEIDAHCAPYFTHFVHLILVRRISS
jgi:hypothetical protein